MLAVAIVVYSATLLAFSALFARAPAAGKLPSCASSRISERPGSLLGPPIRALLALASPSRVSDLTLRFFFLAEQSLFIWQSQEAPR